MTKKSLKITASAVGLAGVMLIAGVTNQSGFGARELTEAQEPQFTSKSNLQFDQVPSPVSAIKGDFGDVSDNTPPIKWDSLTPPESTSRFGALMPGVFRADEVPHVQSISEFAAASMERLQARLKFTFNELRENFADRS